MASKETQFSFKTISPSVSLNKESNNYSLIAPVNKQDGDFALKSNDYAIINRSLKFLKENYSHEELFKEFGFNPMDLDSINSLEEWEADDSYQRFFEELKREKLEQAGSKGTCELNYQDRILRSPSAGALYKISGSKQGDYYIFFRKDCQSPRKSLFLEPGKGYPRNLNESLYPKKSYLESQLKNI